MTSRTRRIFEEARDILQVGDAQPVHYWFQHDVLLIPVDVTALDNDEHVKLRDAICQHIGMSTIDLSDADILDMHKKLTSEREVIQINLDDAKCDTIDEPLFAIYYYNTDSVKERMIYYDTASLERGSKCFDLEHLSHGRILLSNFYVYGFLVRNEKGPYVFIHNDSLYTVLFFNPINPFLHSTGLPWVNTWTKVSCPDNETRAILASANARYNASMYFANIQALVYREKNKKGCI
jgi:hypothetical protein